MKNAVLILLAFVFVGNIYAQKMPDIIRTMPDTLLPLLTHNDRLDFIDYLESGMKAEVTNRLGGKSEMTIVSDDYAHIKMSESSDIAFKLLPYDGDSIICMIRTYLSGASDSRLEFYTKGWRKLPVDAFISIPTRQDFLTSVDTLSEDEREILFNKLDVCFMKAEFATIPSSNDLKFIFTTPLYLSEEDMEFTQPFIKEVVSMKWNGKSFE